jgi:hypothetical protein
MFISRLKYSSILLVCVVLMLSQQGCKSKDELLALSKCEFRVKDVSDIFLAGVAVENVDDFSDIDFVDGLILWAAASAGNLPLSLKVNVEIRNPNSELAALNKAEWKLYVDNLFMAEGTYDERIEIPPNDGIATLSIPVSVNLAELLQGDTGMALLNLALNLAEIGDEPTRITLSAKPYIYVGKRLIRYPGFFDVSTEFTSGD